MNKMVNIMFAAVTSFSAASAIAGTTVNIYGDDGYAPYSYEKGGKMEGIDSRIIEEANKRIPEYDIVLKPISWKKGLKLLETGKIGFLYPPYYRPELRPYMAYSDDMMDEKLVLFCNAELVDNGVVNFPDDFKGLKIGKKLGYASGAAFDQAKADGTIEVFEIQQTKAILNRLIQGGLDCYVNDKLSTVYELKQMQELGAYDGKSIKESATLSNEKTYIGVTKHDDKYPYKADFLEKFNKVLGEMKAEGTVDKIINE